MLREITNFVRILPPNNMRRILLLICLFVILVTPAVAQLYQYLDTQNGLSSRRVLSIRKDKKGYMWFLTHEGIDRYNGKQYTHYSLTANGKLLNFFPNLNTLQIDTAGVVWEIGKTGHLFKYNSLQDKFELVCDFASKDKSNSGLPLTASFLDSKDNNILLCTKNKQYLFDIDTHELIQLESPIKEEITYIAKSTNNQYFLASSHKIYCARLNHGRLEVIKHPELDNFHIVNYIYFHPETQMLVIGTLLDGIYLYNIHSRQLIDVHNGLQDINVNSIIASKENENEVLIATNGAGVYKLNLGTYELTNFLNADHNHSNKMNGNIINDIYIDDDQKLWMAVYPIGITVYSEKYPGYQWIQHSYDNPNSLIDNQVNYILEDSEGDIWYATNNGVCCYSPSTKQWTNLLSTYQHDTPNQNHVFISICESRPGVILVGGYMSGMYKIDKKNMTTQYFIPQTLNDDTVKPDKYIRCIYKDWDNLIWAGGYYNLKSYDLDTKEMHCYNMDFPITYITNKDAHNLWIGTINGLYQFNKVNQELKAVNLDSELGCINTIYQSKKNITFIGTHGSGMWIYNNYTEKVTNYHINNSALISNNIHCILPALEDDLIISTEKGLTRFKTKEKIFSNWTKEQGLMSTSFNQAAGVHTRDKKFIFGCGDGAIELADTVTLPHQFKSKMVFDNFRLLYQKVMPGEKGSPLKEEIDDTRHIILNYDQNIFSLDVSSINYDNPSNIVYSWKLEGFYDEWTSLTNDNRIRYTNISPGKYKLRVRAILMDDHHLLEERSLFITITPPWWATFWAGILYLIIFILVGVIVLRYLWLRKDRNNSKEKIRFFINTAHDIRTPLTLIKAPLGEILKNENLSEQGRININLAIQNTDNLSELASNLINFEKEELYTSTVYVSRYELNNYIKNYLEQFNLYARKRQINIIFETNFESQEVWLDRNKMDSIIRNLMTNALKYTCQGGNVTVQTQKNKSHWFITITDTGIGIPANEQKKMFKSLFRGNNAINLQITGSGIGMLLTYKLAFPIKSRKYNYRIFKKADVIDPLPVIEGNPEELVKEIKNKPAKTHAASILIVEDNMELRTFLLHTLSEDYNVSDVGNGQEALDFIKERQPDLILSDVMMPIMNGDKMCNILKNNIETSHIPIILLTALNDKESIIKGLQTKADKYIVKPFDMEVLKANIANVLANREIMKKRFSQFKFNADEVSDDPTISLEQEFLLKATNIIKSSINKEINVENLCDAMNMSRSSLYNKIKALTNDSPSDFIRKVRMNEASILLKSKRYTVSEVSDMMGFSDPKYFTDTFKKYYRVPPSTYMKQN